jgi:hypothetical protein
MSPKQRQSEDAHHIKQVIEEVYQQVQADDKKPPPLTVIRITKSQ